MFLEFLFLFKADSKYDRATTSGTLKNKLNRVSQEYVFVAQINE